MLLRGHSIGVYTYQLREDPLKLNLNCNFYASTLVNHCIRFDQNLIFYYDNKCGLLLFDINRFEREDARGLVRMRITKQNYYVTNVKINDVTVYRAIQNEINDNVFVLHLTTEEKT